MPAKKKLDSAYQSVNPKEMILRDHLAFDRTVLANERTILSYARTAIALLITGLMVFKIFAEEWPLWSMIGGCLLMLLALVVGIFGAFRFFASRGRLAKIYHAAYEPLEIDEE
ncbi:MAG: hypothetical protein COA78_26415 [Blastopirellula sp.]|nr:MAG: hypothetical protein COA78_26415 [Blastopirellula sp.]